MSTSRKILNFSLAGIVLAFIFTVWYNEQYGMDTVAPFEINDASLDNQILIATQGSTYKNRVVADVLSSFYYDSIYIKIIDVHDLGKEEITNWDAIVILHTWELSKPPQIVTDFVEKVVDRNKLFMVTTSGTGTERMEGVDGISSASLMYEIPNQVQSIVDRIHGLITTQRTKDITGVLHLKE